MAQAKDRDQYVRVWNSHVDELTTMYSALSVEDMNELAEIRGRLHELIVEAADREFKE